MTQVTLGGIKKLPAYQTNNEETVHCEGHHLQKDERKILMYGKSHSSLDINPTTSLEQKYVPLQMAKEKKQV